MLQRIGRGIDINGNININKAASNFVQAIGLQ